VSDDSILNSASALLSGQFTFDASASEKENPNDPLKTKQLDLKESLEWLLGSDDDFSLPQEERSMRRERRFELLLWILNLELRLNPYIEFS
jgi:hypothetical protein